MSLYERPEPCGMCYERYCSRILYRCSACGVILCEGLTWQQRPLLLDLRYHGRRKEQCGPVHKMERDRE